MGNFFRLRQFTLVLCIVMTGCVGTIPSEKFLNYKERSFIEDVPAIELTLSDAVHSKENLDECLISDSLLICLSTGNSEMYDVFELSTGEKLGSFCHIGRAREEVLSGLPLRSLFQNGEGNLCADVFSLTDGKLMQWNVSASILSGRDVYDRICILNEGQFLPLSSVLRLDDNRIIALDVGVGYPTMQPERVPDYYEYELGTGSKKRSFGLFKKVEIKHENDLFPSMVYYNCVDCLSPDKSRIVVAMNFMPVLSVVDVASGVAKGYKLKGVKDFSVEEPVSYFADVQADEKYIYALYSGQKIDFETGLKQPDYLFVLDWDGRMVAKYHLNESFSRIHLDGENLYFTHWNGRLASIPLSVLV